MFSLRGWQKKGRGVDWKGDMDEQGEWAGRSSRERMVWELLARLSMEYATEVWWTGERSACSKLELAQIKIGRRLLGESNTVAGVAVQGDLEWRKGGKR